MAARNGKVHTRHRLPAVPRVHLSMSAASRVLADKDAKMRKSGVGTRTGDAAFDAAAPLPRK